MPINVNNDNFDIELGFTKAYLEHKDDPIALREAACLKAQFPASFDAIRDGDLLAGRLKNRIFGFGLEEASGGKGGYGLCRAYNDCVQIIKAANISDERRQKITEELDFWKEEGITAKHRRAAPWQPSVFPRLAGVYLNYDKLLTIGMSGLAAEIESKKNQALVAGKDTSLFEAMKTALCVLSATCMLYADMAREQAQQTASDKRKCELERMADALDNVAHKKPASFREAIQLSYLYSLISGVVNYGRMDVYIGDFYVNDVDTGVITEGEALELLMSLWKLIADRDIIYNGRIIIGGMGRRNEANADRFALAAMEATRRVIETEPQLSLRFYKGMNPELLKRAYDVIAERGVYPMLYNDDVNVPAVAKAFEIDLAEAEQYLPYGCGEYAIDHRGLSSPNSVQNMLKAVNAALHDKVKEGGVVSFEDLLDAYKANIEHSVDLIAKSNVIEYEVERENACYLFVTALFDDCLERGKSVVDGGARYAGGLIESFGMVNAGDSLAAIKRLVYDVKAFTLGELVEMLDADFEGFDLERRMMLNAPKYGNDDDYVDYFVCMLSDHLSDAAVKAGKKYGLKPFLAVNINNFANVTEGQATSASADGRKSGEPLANGNTPTAGMDRNGVTAFLNSISKIDASKHAGYVHNMKFSKRMLKEARNQFEALMETYFDNNGSQAMITVVNRGDLENAMKEPEKYANLIVRVGGFCARFVGLDKNVQKDILNRTLY